MQCKAIYRADQIGVSTWPVISASLIQSLLTVLEMKMFSNDLISSLKPTSQREKGSIKRRKVHPRVKVPAKDSLFKEKDKRQSLDVKR